MGLATKRDSLQVRGSIELLVQHEGRRRVFAYPPYGPNNRSTVFFELREQIAIDGLVMSTAAELVSLLYVGVQNSTSRYFHHLCHCLVDGFVVDTGLLACTDEIYIQDHPEARIHGIHMAAGSLERRLPFANREARLRKSDDGEVGSIAYGYETDRIEDKDKIRDNPFLLALLGQEGIEKLMTVLRYGVRSLELNVPNSNQITHQKTVSIYTKSDTFCIDAFNHGRFAIGTKRKQQLPRKK